MNPKFLNTIIVVISSLLLHACGNNRVDPGSKTGRVDSVRELKTAEVVAITDPQNMMVIRHKVVDFAKWKTSYDANAPMRIAFGVHDFVVGRSMEDSNMIIVTLKIEDIDKARAFEKSADLKIAMMRSGVIGTAAISIYTIVYQNVAKPESDKRLMTTFTVQDWDTWRKTFENHKEIRSDSDLIDKAYGYRIDDKRQAMMILSVNNVAKAEAFWQSPLLKKIRADGKVVSEPERFVYRVTQLYY